MNEAAPIRKATLSGEAAAGVRGLILDGDLDPGERINEKTLCERFGVSRTPLREALKVLASEGLVELLPNRGARVARITAEAIDEIFPVMGALEALAGELAAERMDAETMAEVRAEHYRMALHHTRGELAGYFRGNQRIHELILAAAGNPTLAATYRALSGRVRLARLHANISRTRWDAAMAEHEDILRALEARDGAALATVLRDHLRNTCESVKAGLGAA